MKKEKIILMISIPVSLFITFFFYEKLGVIGPLIGVLFLGWLAVEAFAESMQKKLNKNLGKRKWLWYILGSFLYSIGLYSLFTETVLKLAAIFGKAN